MDSDEAIRELKDLYDRWQHQSMDSSELIEEFEAIMDEVD